MLDPTPNMGLTLPEPSAELGPLWAQAINDAFSVVDDHDHSSGNGLRIRPAGLNINADLTFQSNRLTDVKLARFTSQSAVFSDTTDKNQLYVVNGELYYQDSSGTNVQVTSDGSINIAGVGGISGLSGTTAALTYSDITKTFAFTQAANTAAKLDGGPITIRDTAANAKGITLQSPTSLANNFSLTLPAALPGTNYALTLTDTSGVQTYLGLGAANQVLAVNSGGTAAAWTTLDIQSSSGTGAGTNITSTTAADVPGTSVSFTSNGRPLVVTLESDGSGVYGGVEIAASSGGAQGSYQLVRGSTVIGTYLVNTTAAGASSTQVILTPGLTLTETPAAGSYTYKLQASVSSGTTIKFLGLKLVVRQT